MVKITNGINIFSVSRGAFGGIYSHQGYTIVDEEKNDNSEDIDNTGDTVINEDEVFANELLEKPISQWNKDEIKRFAQIKCIDISGTKNANEAKDRIKDFLDSQE